jgi:hypothetical protein
VLRGQGAAVYLVANPSRGDLASSIAKAEWHRVIGPDLADTTNVYPVFRESDGQGLPELNAFLSAYPGWAVYSSTAARLYTAFGT